MYTSLTRTHRRHGSYPASCLPVATSTCWILGTSTGPARARTPGAATDGHHSQHNALDSATGSSKIW